MSDLRVVYDSDHILKRICETAAVIAEDYVDQPLVLVGILKGSAFFLADLARHFPRAVDFEFVFRTSPKGRLQKQVPRKLHKACQQ